MTNVTFLKTSNQLTVYLNGKSMSMSKDNPNFNSVTKLLKSDQLNDRKVKKLENLFSKANSVIEYFDSNGMTINIKNGVIYYGDLAIRSSIVDRILEMKNRGLKPDNLIRFIERLSENPSSQSVNELYEFIKVNNLPIRPDGKFLAYKKVRGNYTDIRSGRFDNRPGKTVRLRSRKDVDPDRDRTCSNGLHVCSYDYLEHFGSFNGCDRVVVVAVDPADVVTVPSDYNNAKMRVVGYEVIKDVGDWYSIRLRDFIVEDEKDMFAEKFEDEELVDMSEKEEELHKRDGLDPLIYDYDLEPEDGFEYLEDFSNFAEVEYKAVQNTYRGYILARIPSNVPVKTIIDFLKDNPDENDEYFINDADPYSFLNYFEYIVDLKDNVSEKDRYLVVLVEKNDEAVYELRLATPSVSTIDT